MTETLKMVAGADALMESALSDKEIRIQDGTPFLVVHDNMRMHSLEFMLKNPLRAKTEASFTYPAAFSDYVKEFSGENTRMFATRTRGSREDTVVAEVDYHQAKGLPSWRDHKATLTMRKGVDWLKWISVDGTVSSHAALIDFLTDYRNELIKFTSVNEKGEFEERTVASNIVLDMLRRLKVNRTTDNDSEVASGSFSAAVKTTERVLADGKPWPEILTVALPVYDGMARWEMNFRISYVEGRFKITLIRPELVEQAAFDQACGSIIDATGVVIYGYKGTAPTSEPTPEEPKKKPRLKKAEVEERQPAAEEAAIDPTTQPPEGEYFTGSNPTETAPLPEPIIQESSPAPAAPAPWAKPQA